MRRKKFELRHKRGRPKGSKNKKTILKEQGKLRQYHLTPEKKQLIEEIKKYKQYHIDLQKFTIKQLQKHLQFIKDGGRN